MQLIRQLISPLIDFLFPKSRLIRTLEAMKREKLVRLFTEHSKGLESPPFGIRSLFAYRDEAIHDLIHEIKYSANRLLAGKIAPALYDACKELSFGFPAILTFIPTSKNRKIKRGFDQGTIILNAIKLYDKEVNDKPLFTYSRELLVWNRDTVQQSATANKEERQKNVSFALTCADQLSVRNRTIIVLDDICTTGATLIEAKRSLEEVGAAKVHLLTLAH